MEKASNKETADYIIEKRFLSEISAAELISRIIRSHIKSEDRKRMEDK